MKDIQIIKRSLIGVSLRKTMERKKTNKYRISKATGIAYRTLCYWQAEKSLPSDDSAILVGKYLGLISDPDEVLKLKKDMESLQKRLDQIEA